MKGNFKSLVFFSICAALLTGTKAHALDPVVTVCGNGVLEDGEGCDDGNIKSGDGCNYLCLRELQYTLPVSTECGNGVLEDGEDCDDGNVNSGDGCNYLCLRELQYTQPVSIECGNGVLEDGEGCDDGNVNSGDGCNYLCLRELQYTQPVSTESGNETVEGGEAFDETAAESHGQNSDVGANGGGSCSLTVVPSESSPFAALALLGSFFSGLLMLNRKNGSNGDARNVQK